MPARPAARTQEALAAVFSGWTVRTHAETLQVKLSAQQKRAMGPAVAEYTRDVNGYAGPQCNADAILAKLEGETPNAAHADKLGTFVRCAEPWEGKPVFTREGFAGKWQILMWWHSGTRHWFVGRRSELGTKKGWLKLPSDDASPCGVEGSPEAGGWLVYDSSSKSWVAAPDLNCIAAPYKEWHA